MRIGPLTNLSFQKYEPSSTRDIIQKHIPGYLQVQNYDLVSQENIITVSGTLVGSSNANLSTQIEQLKAMHRHKRVVWIDASDQYQYELSLSRITKLTGPMIDSSKGPLVASFSLQAESLPPWGTTHTNPFNQSGIVFRDLDGRLLGNAVNPLDDNSNFTGSPAGGPFTSFSWEFIVDNQNPFTNVTSVQEALCNSLTSPENGAVLSIGTDTAFGSDALDSTNLPNSGYTAVCKFTKSSPAASTSYSSGYDFGSAGINFSAYDRLRLWYKCDQAGQSDYYIGVIDTSGNKRYWAFSLQGASIWQQLQVDLSVYTGQSSTPNWNAIRYVYVGVGIGATAPSSVNVWMADIRAEFGYINHCEDTSAWSVQNGTSTTLSNDAVIFKNSYYGIGAQPLPSVATAETSALSSIKLAGTSTTGGWLGPVYTFPVSGWDISSYDFMVVWARADFGGATTGTIRVQIDDNSGNYAYWDRTSCIANEWYRLALPLRNPTATGGTSPSLTDIINLIIQGNGSVSAASNFWVDEIAVDVQRWVNFEFHIPDNIAQNNANAVQWFSWNGSSYAAGIGESGVGVSNEAGAFYLLDGTLNTLIGPNSYPSVFTIGSIGSQPQYAQNNDGNAPPLASYTTTWGSKTRFAIGAPFPPATSDSNSGNLPSDDLTGFQAINKVRIKVQVYIANEDTSYTI